MDDSQKIQEEIGMFGISEQRNKKLKNFKLEKRNAIVLEIAIEEISTFLVKCSTAFNKEQSLLQRQAWTQNCI